MMGRALSFSPSRLRIPLEASYPFISTYAIFGSMRMVEQIRQEICYPKLNVKIACSHGGLTPANDGMGAAITRAYSLSC